MEISHKKHIQLTRAVYSEGVFRGGGAGVKAWVDGSPGRQDGAGVFRGAVRAIEKSPSCGERMVPGAFIEETA